MNGRHISSASRKPTSNTNLTRTATSNSRMKSTAATNGTASRSAVKSSAQDVTPEVDIEINSIYPEIVDLISTNTKCDRKIAERTFVEIAQLVNSSVSCQLGDSYTTEVVSKLFHVKVDPEKNLLSSLSFALTAISLEDCPASPPDVDDPEGAENHLLELDEKQNPYESAKSIQELVQLMESNWEHILSTISKSG